MDASTGLTCLCCRVVFADGNIQREHYKTDWHRYNLKRKITGFCPVNEEQFNLKVIDYKNEIAAGKTAIAEVIICECCNKQFQSTNAYDNHVNSKKHKEKEANSSKKEVKVTKKTAAKQQSLVDDSTLETDNYITDRSDDEDNDDDSNSDIGMSDYDTSDEDFDDSKAIPITNCLFCNHNSNDVETNLIHMSIKHGFFLPDAEFCTDVDGMLLYLGMKVGAGNMCLFCNERKKFSTLDACQKHMRDKRHCRVAHSAQEMLEFEDFYDYSSMYPEGENTDEPADIILTDDGYSLTLPSGAKIGHRSLLRYYRQRFKSNGNEVEIGHRRRKTYKNVIGQYKALGWCGLSGQVAVQRAKDVRYMKTVKSKYWLKLGLSNNKLFKSRGRSDQC